MTRGRLLRRLQPAFGIAEERDHFVADDLDDLLRRRQAAEHILPQRPIAHAVDERLDDLEIDVGFEQREPNLAKRRLHVLGSQPRLAPKGLENVLKAIAERLEHYGFQGSCSRFRVRGRRWNWTPSLEQDAHRAFKRLRERNRNLEPGTLSALSALAQTLIVAEDGGICQRRWRRTSASGALARGLKPGV